MVMAVEHKVEIGDNTLTTKVVKTITQLDESLSDLLSTIGLNMAISCRPVIALDIQAHYYRDEIKNRVTEKVAVVKLCFDKTCLLIQLMQIKEPPCSLAELLQVQELTFVGVGIKTCLDALGRDYGLSCRNAVDLGELAANVKGNDKYKSYGLLDLGYEIGVFFPRRTGWHTWHKGSAFPGGWGGTELSQDYIEVATWSAFLCSCVSHQLFTGNSYKFTKYC